MAGGEASVTTRTSSGSVISCRGGPRHGPPPPPTLGRAPAKPWRASRLTQDVSSAQRSKQRVGHVIDLAIGPRGIARDRERARPEALGFGIAVEAKRAMQRAEHRAARRDAGGGQRGLHGDGVAIETDHEAMIDVRAVAL